MASRLTGPFMRGGGDPLVSIYREMNRMFDDVLGGALGGGRQQGSLMAMPTLDVHEKDNELCVSVELPGVKAGDVDVRLESDTLTISGEKKSEDEQKQANYHVTERSYGRFSRSLQLPFRPDPDQVRADFEHGVLTIRLQRAQQQSSRRIEVRSGGPSSAGAGASSGGAGAGGDGGPGTSSGAGGGGTGSGGGASASGSAGGGATGTSQPAPRNDEAGYGVSAGSAREGSGTPAGDAGGGGGMGSSASGTAGSASGAMGRTGTEAGASRSVGS
jgi:HSP20 family protein